MEATATITDRLKTRVDHLLVRVRTALDLPSRSELLELTSRLAELDQRISALAAERVAAMTEPRLELPEAADQDAAKPKKKKA